MTAMIEIYRPAKQKDRDMWGDPGERDRNRINSRSGLHTLEHAVEIGLGNLKYNLESIDK